LDLEFFFNGKTHGPGPRSLWTGGATGSTVDHERRGQRAWRRLTGALRMSTRGHRCLLALAEEDEQDEVVSEGHSLERDLRPRGGAMAAKSGGGSRARGKVQGAPSVELALYRGWGGAKEGAMGSNGRSNGLSAVDGRGG
jgi:hypothetical protein